MGVLADIYVSSAARAAEYDTNPAAFEGESASWKSFTELELSTLWALLQGREWDAELMKRFENVLTKDRGERMITHVPDQMLHDLISADATRIDEAVSAWAATEELNCEPDDVRPFVDDLKRLAQAALASNRGVYLWNCV